MFIGFETKNKLLKTKGSLLQSINSTFGLIKRLMRN